MELMVLVIVAAVVLAVASKLRGTDQSLPMPIGFPPWPRSCGWSFRLSSSAWRTAGSLHGPSLAWVALSQGICRCGA